MALGSAALALAAEEALSPAPLELALPEEEPVTAPAEALARCPVKEATGLPLPPELAATLPLLLTVALPLPALAAPARKLALGSAAEALGLALLRALPESPAPPPPPLLALAPRETLAEGLLTTEPAAVTLALRQSETVEEAVLAPGLTLLLAQALPAVAPALALPLRAALALMEAEAPLLAEAAALMLNEPLEKLLAR